MCPVNRLLHRKNTDGDHRGRRPSQLSAAVGTVLYAAGMSSVKAVKLTMKLTPTTPT